MTQMLTVREISTLPAGARGLSTLAATAGYTDTFLVDVPVAERSPEGWARLILEHAPMRLRESLPRGWALLGLRHGAVGSPDHVLGWPIRASADTHLLLGAESRLGMPAELLIARWDDGLLFATVIRFDNILMRALWSRITDSHKRIVRGLLLRAADTHRAARAGDGLSRCD